ncbi:MAG: FAD-dependent monooxygenase [Proteobacteria bacterium]|nr:FAD-dependent monooxygenase [Pseudomonadota bacterium]
MWTEQDIGRVLIVGAGPVGQMAALLLAHHGIQSCLVDRRREASTAPKAHALNARTLEICNSIGISANRLRELGAGVDEAGYVRFVGTMTGPEFGALPYERQDEGALEFTPFPLSNVSQPIFERELQKHVLDSGLIDFRRGVECTSLLDRGDEVDAILKVVETGDIQTLPFRYVIASDGASSKLRGLVGIEMEGPDALANYLMIHFRSDLRSITEGKRGVLYFLLEPGLSGALIAYDQAKTWVLMHDWNPDVENLEDYTVGKCRALIERAVGQPLPETTIENISPWVMTAQVAKTYRKGRIFLAGDSAHRIPPAGGLGLNTGVGDVQNLTWKLAAVMKGVAGDSLLDTYESERQPIARINNEQSLNNAMKMFELIVAVHGLDPDKTAERYASVAKSPNAFPELLDAVAAQKPHFDSFNLQIGYRYNSEAIINPAPVPGVPNVSDYRPSWDAGAHFPHRWVQHKEGTVALQSLLSSTAFTLLHGPESTVLEGHPHLSQLTFGVDFDDKDSWQNQTGLPDNGALLIRPDGHIAAHFDQVDDDRFVSVVQQILARR